MIKIVHISDLHFCAISGRMGPKTYLNYLIKQRSFSANSLRPLRTIHLPSSHDPDLSASAARFIYEDLSDHDAILITGDLATTGMPEDLALAQNYVLQPAHPILGFYSSGTQPTLFTDVDLPIIIVPGNHDRFQDNVGNVGCDNFGVSFVDLWGAGANGVQAKLLENTDTCEELILVSADFCLESDSHSIPAGWPYRCGQGYAYQNILVGLTRKTFELRDSHKNAGIIWVSHFPPSKNTNILPTSLELLFHKKLVSAARNLDIRYILCGHIHESTSYTVRDVEIICAGAACTYAEVAGNWLHSLAFEIVSGNPKLISRENYQYEEVAGDFIKI